MYRHSIAVDRAPIPVKRTTCGVDRIWYERHTCKIGHLIFREGTSSYKVSYVLKEKIGEVYMFTLKYN